MPKRKRTPKKSRMLPTIKIRKIEMHLRKKLKPLMQQPIDDIIEIIENPHLLTKEAEIPSDGGIFLPPSLAYKLVNKYTNDIYAAIASDTRKATKTAALYASQSLGQPFDARFFNRYVEPVVLQKRFQIVTTTITQDLSNSLKEGILAMLKKGATSKQAISYFSGLKTNYRTIARTEVLSAANRSSWLMTNKELDDIGIKQLVNKTWNISGVNTREAHVLADQQTVPFDEFFIVGGEQAMHPQDPNMSPGNLINCQCYMTKNVEGLQ